MLIDGDGMVGGDSKRVSAADDPDCCKDRAEGRVGVVPCICDFLAVVPVFLVSPRDLDIMHMGTVEDLSM